MNIIVKKQGITFVGQVKDIIDLFDNYPADTRLLDYINLKLH